MSKQKVSLTVPPNYITQVDEIAERRKRSRSFIVAEAIEKYLDNGHAAALSNATHILRTKKKAGTR